MAITIFPRELGSEDERTLHEQNLARILGHYGSSSPRDQGPSHINHVRNGLGYSSAAGLVGTWAAGVASINGYTVVLSASEDLTLTASATNYVYLQLIHTSNKVTGAQLITVTASPTTIPAAAVLLTRVITDGSGVTSQLDRRAWAWGTKGTYNGADSNFQVILGYRARIVAVDGQTAFSINFDGPASSANLWETVTCQDYGFQAQYSGANGAASTGRAATHNFFAAP